MKDAVIVAVLIGVLIGQVLTVLVYCLGTSKRKPDIILSQESHKNS